MTSKLEMTLFLEFPHLVRHFNPFSKLEMTLFPAVWHLVCHFDPFSKLEMTLCPAVPQYYDILTLFLS